MTMQPGERQTARQGVRTAGLERYNTEIVSNAASVWKNAGRLVFRAINPKHMQQRVCKTQSPDGNPG